MLQLRQNLIKDCGKKSLQIKASLLQTMAGSYYKLRQKITNYTKNLLQITAARISLNYWWLLQFDVVRVSLLLNLNIVNRIFSAFIVDFEQVKTDII